jgi:8-oxo-dGTP diphosphatase/2-hydroxy-dATP diphosphatase
MKKRGFGAGRWNGFGGKVQQDENVEDAAKRELYEEVGITPRDLKSRGILNFHFENDSITLEVHLFSASDFEGEPTESEEMRPQWFSYDMIPYDTMWPDDRFWLPQFLSGNTIDGEFFFKDSDTLLSHTIETL